MEVPDAQRAILHDVGASPRLLHLSGEAFDPDPPCRLVARISQPSEVIHDADRKLSVVFLEIARWNRPEGLAVIDFHGELPGPVGIGGIEHAPLLDRVRDRVIVLQEPRLAGKNRQEDEGQVQARENGDFRSHRGSGEMSPESLKFEVAVG